MTEGRDQGSVVFPDAVIKFYLDADPRVRAERRAKQLAGDLTGDAFEALVAELRRRDERDLSRPDGPLVCAPGAIVVETTTMDFDEVVDTLERQVRDRVTTL